MPSPNLFWIRDRTVVGPEDPARYFVGPNWYNSSFGVPRLTYEEALEVCKEYGWAGNSGITIEPIKKEVANG